MFFFLVEERSEAGQVSQLVRACKPGLGDLSKLTATAYFFGGKLMLVGVMNLGRIQKVRFVVVKIFRSYSNQFSVKLTSLIPTKIFIYEKQNKVCQIFI